MRICIVGAGAIGGFLGAKLIQAGAEVTLIARGAHLAAIEEQGLTIVSRDERRETVRPALATADMAAAGRHDLVIVAVKAQALPTLAAPMRVLYGPDTAVVYAQNGIPWWYFLRHGGPYEGRRIETVDPGGVIMANTEIERVVGCVVYPAAIIEQPGVIRHIEGNRFSLGEPDGSRSERALRLSKLLESVGLRAPVKPDIRNEIWLKLWGNLSFNPISALTRATIDRIIGNQGTHSLVATMMAEAQQVAEALGVRFPISIERRIRMAEEIGAHKTSMLQDIEAKRPTEIDALLGAVIELADLTQTPVPSLRAIYAVTALLDQINREA